MNAVFENFKFQIGDKVCHYADSKVWRAVVIGRSFCEALDADKNPYYERMYLLSSCYGIADVGEMELTLAD